MPKAREFARFGLELAQNVGVDELCNVAAGQLGRRWQRRRRRCVGTNLSFSAGAGGGQGQMLFVVGQLHNPRTLVLCVFAFALYLD